MKNRSRRDELLRRLNVDREVLASQPDITSMAKECGISLPRIVEVLRGDEGGMSKTVAALWDSLTPASQRMLDLESLAVASGLTSRRLWELYCGAGAIRSRDKIGAMLAEHLPTMMRNKLKWAMKEKAVIHQEHLMKTSRLLPTPKNSVINIGMPQPAELGKGDDGEFEDLEGADDFLMRASRAMTAKQLPATVEAEILDPDEEEEEDED